MPAPMLQSSPAWETSDLKPLVSILIPAYNSQQWLGDTLRSAIAQTWERKEIIVVDDGSRDQTLAVARQFESQGVNVIAQDNQGASAARNKAFSVCQGDYIQWLDADDLLAPHKITRQMEALERRPGKRVLLSGAWGRFLYRHSRAKFIPTGLWRDLSPQDWLVCKLADNVFMQTGAWLVSRELTEQAGIWDTSLLADDDGEYFCRVLLGTDEIRFVPDARVYYRASGSGSLSHLGRSQKKIDAQWRSYQLHINHLQSLEQSARVRTACLTYLQTSLLYFYPERPDIVEQAKELAKNLGGQLEPPPLSWKYSWINSIFGYRTAKRARLDLPLLKESWIRYWDKLLFHIEKSELPKG